jgi:hypothetical protein
MEVVTFSRESMDECLLRATRLHAKLLDILVHGLIEGLLTDLNLGGKVLQLLSGKHFFSIDTVTMNIRLSIRCFIWPVSQLLLPVALVMSTKSKRNLKLKIHHALRNHICSCIFLCRDRGRYSGFFAAMVRSHTPEILKLHSSASVYSHLTSCCCICSM